MSQRQGLAQIAVDGVHSITRFHPHTGEPIVPVGFRRDGRAIWPIIGASEDDGDEGDDDTDDGSDDGSDDDDDGSDDGHDDEAKRRKQDDSLTRENARRRREAKELREQLAEAQAELKKFQDKDKGDLEKASESVQELTTKNEALEERVATLALNNAFLSDNTFKWKNPKAALRLADLSEVEISDEGEVTGLSEALKALAESDPYLLDKGSDDEDDSTPPSPGQPPKRKKTKGAPERDNLLKKYPALRRG